MCRKTFVEILMRMFAESLNLVIGIASVLLKNTKVKDETSI